MDRNSEDDSSSKETSYLEKIRESKLLKGITIGSLTFALTLATPTAEAIKEYLSNQITQEQVINQEEQNTDLTRKVEKKRYRNIQFL